VDRFTDFRMGRRRFWIAVAIVGAHGALATLLLVDDPLATVGLVSAVFLAHSVFASLLDTALDGTIIDQVPPAELGRTSACTRGGFVTGAALSAALCSWSLGAYGFGPTVAALSPRAASRRSRLSSPASGRMTPGSRCGGGPPRRRASRRPRPSGTSPGASLPPSSGPGRWRSSCSASRWSSP
jgi:hypothetical protein